LTVGGQIVLEPSPTELSHLIPRILGGTVSGITYSLTETLPTFVVSIDRVAKVYSYTGCKVDKAIFKSGPGQGLELTLDIEALTESIGNAGSFASLTIDAHPPFVFFDGVLTLASNPIQMQEFELTIDNMLKKDRFVNSQTRTDLPEIDRVVTLRCVVPYTSDTLSLYDGGAAGVTADLKFSVGGSGDGSTGTSLHFLLQNVVFPARKSPVAQSKEQEITLLLEGQVYKTSSSAELQVKVDLTP
jgi:hypothetical protein